MTVFMTVYKGDWGLGMGFFVKGFKSWPWVFDVAFAKRLKLFDACDVPFVPTYIYQTIKSY
jgi:hypothetical protein